MNSLVSSLRRLRSVLAGRSAHSDIAAAAARNHCHLQSIMDIDPASPWHPKSMVTLTGGYSPPGQSRPRLTGKTTDRTRFDTLCLLLREIIARDIPGSLAELGVYRGETARFIHHYSPERKLYLFDTFQGFASADLAAETHDFGYNRQQQFTDTNEADVLRFIAPCTETVILRAGRFPDSLQPSDHGETFAFAHLDLDLEAPTVAGLEFFWPRLSRGGYIVVHDYNAWPGARLAVDRFREKENAGIVPVADKSGSVVITKA